jgi:hypothetical protein
MKLLYCLVVASVTLMSQAHAGEKVSQLASKARSEARRWQSDASLVEINASIGADGTVGPADGVIFNFFSPSNGQYLMVSMAGAMVHSTPMPHGEAKLPIPERFMGLSDAAAAVRKRGFEASRVSGTLRVHQIEAGNRPLWMMTVNNPRDSRGNKATIYVDAISGAVGDFAQISGRKEAHDRAQDLTQKKLAPDEQIEFASLRKKADGIAASQHQNFKLYQTEVEFEANSLRISQVDFRYFRLMPGGGSSQAWEQLLMHVSTGGRIRTGRTLGHTYPGTISGSRQTFSDPRPATAAPGNVLTPDEAIRRLNRSPLMSPEYVTLKGGGPDPRRYRREVKDVNDPSVFKLKVQLIQVGAKYYSIGNVTLSPTTADAWPKWVRQTNQPSIYDVFFKKTAPEGKWIWWTVTLYPNLPGERYEYIYMDALTGKATSHCAEPSGPGGLSRPEVVPVPVPCAPSPKGS